MKKEKIAVSPRVETGKFYVRFIMKKGNFLENIESLSHCVTFSNPVSTRFLMQTI